MKTKKFAQNFIMVILMTLTMSLWGAVASFAETDAADVSASVYGTQIATGSTAVVTTEINTERTLPEVERNEVVIPEVIGAVEDKDEPSLTEGFVVWIIVGVIVAATLAVILTSKTKGFRNSGRNRYSTGDKMNSTRHLLNDKYYHNKKRK